MTPDQAMNRLERLGSPEAIAQHLIDLGCTGQSYAASCPVARYIAVESGAATEVGDDVVLLDQWDEDYDEHPRLLLPHNLALFIGDFDNGGYPELNVPSDGDAYHLAWAR